MNKGFFKNLWKKGVNVVQVCLNDASIFADEYHFAGYVHPERVDLYLNGKMVASVNMDAIFMVSQPGEEAVNEGE